MGHMGLLWVLVVVTSLLTVLMCSPYKKSQPLTGTSMTLDDGGSWCAQGRHTDSTKKEIAAHPYDLI